MIHEDVLRFDIAMKNTAIMTEQDSLQQLIHEALNIHQLWNEFNNNEWDLKVKNNNKGGIISFQPLMLSGINSDTANSK